MNRDTEIELINELLALNEGKSAFLDESTAPSNVEIYFDTDRFQAERSQIFTKLAQPLVHTSELPEPNSFLRRELAGLPLLITRDSENQVHVFLNVCRHRGTRLVDDKQGCQKRFSCPYHAWTWSNTGKLIGIPHQKQGFPELDRDLMGLKRLGCVERYGWIWINPQGESKPAPDHDLQGLHEDSEWLNAADHVILHSDEQLCSANWKILVEGGLEAYHFRIAHRNTIGPHFFDNLSTYQTFGNHIRSVLAKRSMGELSSLEQDKWRLRDHAQILYTLFPSNALLVQSDHISWIQFNPVSANSTRIRVSTLAPADRTELPEDLQHWEKNHKITVDTLNEDFAIGESIQSGLQSGANQQLTFGRFEGALAQFNTIVDNHLSAD